MKRPNPTAGAALCAITLAVAACGDAAPSEPAVGASLRLEVVAEPGAEAPAGTPLAEPLRVRVVDAAGRGIPGVGIDWRAVALPWLGDGEQAAVAPASRVSGADGGAEAAWTLGRRTGKNLVVARITGDSAEIRFEVWGVPGPAAVVRVLSASPITAEAGAEFHLLAMAEDAFGNAVQQRPAWSSSDPSIVGVSADGAIQARAPGTADVVATVGAASDTVRVSVVAAEG